MRAKDLVLLQDSDSVASPILLDPTAASIAFAPPLFAPPLTPEMGAQYKGLTLKSIEPSEAHTRVEDWVIFSDLHVKSASIETCEEVLSEVHRCAVERGAGVIFLGDFWHVRGALNVDLLNRILLRLSAWTQPVIMIPGNHDQVTLGGAVHALEPLQYAFAPGQMLLVSEPMVCLGALWVPYRRDHQLLKAILREGASNPAVGIVFCHADVKGASMNDGMKSREGLDVDVFPAHIPVYSGHYHKPHKVPSSLPPSLTPDALSRAGLQGGEQPAVRGVAVPDVPVRGQRGQVPLLHALQAGPAHRAVRVDREGQAGDRRRTQVLQGTMALAVCVRWSTQKACAGESDRRART